MSSLPAFKHDFFISYAHVDNQTFDTEEGWIAMLHQRLEVRLKQLLGVSSLQIWRDPKLGGNYAFGDTLLAELYEAAVLLSVLTPRYLSSDWCQRELNEFRARAEQLGGLKLGENKDRSRIFKVIKTPVERKELPGFLDEVIGYEFFTYEPGGNRFREFSSELGKEKDSRYWSKFEDLAQDLAALLQLVRVPAGVTIATAATTTPASGKTIYLAQTTRDLRGDRDALRRELQQHGHRVLPDKDLSLEGDLRAEVKQFLAECSLAVHLIGDDYGIVPEGEARSVAEVQFDLVSEHSRAAAFPQLIWLPKGLSSSDPRQSHFIELLESQREFGKHTELIRSKLEDLKIIIQEKLAPPPPPPVATAATAVAASIGDLSAAVYLMCDQPDFAAIPPIKVCLEQKGLEVFSSADGIDPQMHEELLRQCDAVLTYDGAASDTWLGQKKMDLSLKLRGLKRERPLLAKAFYLTSPPTSAKESFAIQGGLVLKHYEGFAPAQLEGFFQALRAPQGAAA